jgi:hypothetical protein
MEYLKIFSARMAPSIQGLQRFVKGLGLFSATFSVWWVDNGNGRDHPASHEYEPMTAHAHIIAISCERLEKRMERSASRLWNSYLLFPSL